MDRWMAWREYAAMTGWDGIAESDDIEEVATWSIIESILGEWTATGDASWEISASMLDTVREYIAENGIDIDSIDTEMFL